MAAATCALDRAEVDHTFAQLPRDPRQLAAPAAGAVPAAVGPARPQLPEHRRDQDCLLEGLSGKGLKRQQPAQPLPPPFNLPYAPAN